MSKRAEIAALKSYPEETRFVRDYNQLAKRQIYQEGYERAEKDLIPLINRLCEAILFDWKDKAELARKIQNQIKEENK